MEEKVITYKINNYKKNGFVMSLGGGAYINNNVRKLIYSSGISIWLDASIDIINNRIKNSKNERPLILKFNSKKSLEKLLNDRKVYYQEANIKVNIVNTSKENMTNIILEKIYKFLNSK